MNDLNPLHLKRDDWLILCDILHRYNALFYAYGSRVKNTHKRLSDVDLCYKGSISFFERLRLMDELVESDLRVKVDVSDLDKLSYDFKQRIEKDLILLQL